MIKIGDAPQASVSFTPYIGYAVMRVAAINPTGEELFKIAGMGLGPETFCGKNDQNVEWAQANIWLSPADDNPQVPFVKLPIRLFRQVRKNKDNTKVKVIDKFGNTAWVTNEQFQKQEVPLSQSGMKLPIIPPYELCCVNQDVLTDFIRTWANIRQSFTWDNDKRVFVKKADEELQQCECKLERLKNLWVGDFSEIKQFIEPLKDYKIKVLLMVRSAVVKGVEREYQSVFPQVLPYYRDFDVLRKAYEKEVANGGFKNTRTEFRDAMPYVKESAAAQAAIGDSQYATTADPYSIIGGAQSPTTAPASQPMADDDLPF